MKIGELARTAATPVETIRYYEREGLLPAPARTGANYRDYDAAHLARLQFIRHCRSLDMSLDEVRVLLRFQDDPGPDCSDVNALLDAHIRHVAQRMAELRRLSQALKILRQRCVDLGAGGACGILEGLAEGARAAPHPATAPHHHLAPVHGRAASPTRQRTRPR